MTESFIPYGRQVVEDDDIAAVVNVLRGDWLTTGPAVGEFESAFADYVGAKHAVAVCNGTAALHLSILAGDIGPGDEVIVPALTFAASANCARYAGARVVFADVRPDTLNVDAGHVASLITPRTRAIVAVDYGGLPCDLDELNALASRHGLLLIEDACHAVGATYRSRRVGSIADLTTFSFHPVKQMTTGEGGMITTGDEQLASRLRRLRNHGIATDHRQRELEGTWRYDMVELGFNYRLTDLQCALGIRQVAKLDRWLAHRRAVAAKYCDAFSRKVPLILPTESPDREHAFHLYAVRLNGDDRATRRQRMFAALRSAKIGANVHYLPVYLHSYYQALGYARGLCPAAEEAYDGLLSLPMSHALSEADQDRVIRAVIAAAA